MAKYVEAFVWHFVNLRSFKYFDCEENKIFTVKQPELKTSSESLSHRFQRIVTENLPKRLEMFKVLMESPIDHRLFAQKRQGLKTIVKKLGRLQDFKGIYGFILDHQVVYIDDSSYVLKRVLRQYKGTNKYQRNLHQLIQDAREDLDIVNNGLVAEEQLHRMQIVVMEIPDDLERELTTVYLKCEFDCLYNRYE